MLQGCWMPWYLERIAVSLRGPRLSSWAWASLCLVHSWRGLCISALGRATASSPVRAVYRSARASLCPLYSPYSSWNNAACRGLFAPVHGIFQRPTQSYCLAWAFPLPGIISPALFWVATGWKAEQKLDKGWSKVRQKCSTYSGSCAAPGCDTLRQSETDRLRTLRHVAPV